MTQAILHRCSLRPWAMGLLALGALATVTGCSRGKSSRAAALEKSKAHTAATPPRVIIEPETAPASAAAPAATQQPAPIVLDYGNGWYHTATGGESITVIAAQYEREPALVAQINRTEKTAKPTAGSMIYIPPTNNRERLKPILHKVSRNPDLIPRTPWNKQQQAAVANAGAGVAEKHAAESVKERKQNKAADPWIDRKYARPEIVEQEAAAPKAIASAPAAGATGTVRQPALEGDATAEPERSVKVASLDRSIGLFGSAPRMRETQQALIEIDERTIASGSTLGGGASPQPSTGGAAVRRETPPESTSTAGRARAAKFEWPLQGSVIARFKEGWRKACHGIEIQASEGTPIKASRAGKVLLAEEFLSYGKLIVIDHGDGFATAYGYNRELKVRNGDRVQAGQVIGTVGRPKSGASSRLFFQVRRNAKPVDPLDFLK